MKNETTPIILEFLDRARNAYQRTFCMLELNRAHLQVLRFDTKRDSPNSIAARVLAECGLDAVQQ